MSARTQAEITARFTAIAAADSADMLGFRREVLLDAMTRDTLLALPNVTDADIPADWTPEDTEQAAQRYLTYAIDKILDHRGISASRSVDKLREYAWLLGRRDVMDTMDTAAYPQYGAPKVRAFADGMGWEWPHDPTLERMAAGHPCSDTCLEGCGQ